MRPHHAPAIRRATRSRLSAFVVLAAALLATTLGIAPAGAESYVVPAPVAPGTTDTILTEVECPSAAVCFAVGGEEVSGTSRSTLLRKDGAAWTRVTVPQPVGATATLLNDISCVSETACWAVGFANVGGVPRPLLVRWNGSAWSLGTPPAAAPGTTSNRLESVHCTAASSCWGVGYSTSAGPLDRLVMRWNGTSWTRVTPALPPGTTRSLLYGVTCAGASACWAVGQYTTSGDGLLLMMRWNGSTWTPVAAPAPVGSTSTEAYDVSCAGASFCVATGRSYISATNRPLALRWNGSAWSLLTTPVPPGATEGELVDVSCVSATACWAVGYFVKDEYRRMVQRWNGTTWSIGTTPIPTGSVTSGLNGVDCITADDCWAVGDYALAEPVNSSWPFVARLGSVTPPSPLLTPTPIPTGGTESNLEDTDCPTATACWAVGGTQIGSPRRAMVLRSAGNTWGLVNTPSPPGATRSELRGVDCVSTTLCWAVGEATVGGVRRAMIIRWNGTAWSLATPPSIDYSTLDEVSCPTATFCLAVGNKPGGALDAAALVLRWNGATWSEVTTPAPATATYVALLGVSCPTTTSCWAVGLFQTTDTTRRLVLRWNGSSWSIVTTPLPTGTTQSIFFNVSCGSTTSCALVGYGLISGAQTQLLLRWNASTWSIPTAPTPSGATVTALFGVSCPPASACTAVGIAVVGGSARRMVLRGNLGAWSAVSTPLPPGTSTSNFLAASCTTTTTCTFVGSNSIASLTYPLVVRTT